MSGVAKWGMAMLVVAACLTAASCGGGAKEAVVVRVGENTITGATVDHWIKVESATAHGGAKVTQAQPKGALPVPPEYADCIAYLVSNPQSGYPTPSRGEARAKCSVEYMQYKETILGILISYYWDTEEGAAKGMHVTDAEITHYLKQLYPHPGELQRYLKVTHESLHDERMLVRGKLIGEKLIALSSRSVGNEAERVHAIAKYVAEERARWTPRTSCRRGYVVAQCKQYRGPQA